MKGSIVLDLRNIWDPATMRAAGFTYSSIGRP
jgi:UDPglucose 6-dehydrogenase